MPRLPGIGPEGRGNLWRSLLPLVALPAVSKGTAMTVNEILSRLKMVRQSGDGWSALCQGHEDHNPSLSIMEGEDGRTLLQCHRGCSTEKICAALGITVKDLFTQEASSKRRGTIVQAYDYVDENHHLLFQIVRFAP